jgi:WD40 repeat protein
MLARPMLSRCPHSATIAVGGWTSPTGLNGSVYLFNRASGALMQRLPGLPNVVLHLAFSPDGKRLAAALAGANGIRVFDAAHGYLPLPSDTEYGDYSYAVDFDRDGRLVSASDDGFVRIYAPDDYYKPVVPKTRVKGVGRPFSVAFSAGGRHVAVGDHDSATVAILRAHDLAPERFPTVSGFDNTKLTVAWSKDGQRLFAGGYLNGGRLARRWDNAGSSSFVDITGAANSVSQYVPLRGQRMLFADGSGFGVIDGAGKAIRLKGQGSIDVRQASVSATILVSPDVRTVEVTDNSHLFRFDLARRAIAVDPKQVSSG